jgi:hypothetical protein
MGRRKGGHYRAASAASAGRSSGACGAIRTDSVLSTDEGCLPSTIYRLLQHAAFEPEDVEQLGAAYEEALRVLQVSDRADPITQIIAKRIIKAAQTGIHEPSELCKLAIKDLRVP